jgi:hypothetical protein
MRFMNAVFLFCLSIGIARAQSPGVNLPGPKVTIAVPQQPWQVRSAEFRKTLKAANANDVDAVKAMDAVLTQFEAQPFARTPMENMDILGSLYIPKSQPQPTLILVSANAALGWYDALRFGSESGRSEIVNNDKFFARALLLSGTTATSKFREFMKENPDLARTSVLQGLAIADKERKNPHYDVHWPTAFGLERMICAEGGSCAPPKEMPADQWDKAWEDAKKRVSAYFTVDTSPSPAKQ